MTTEIGSFVVLWERDSSVQWRGWLYKNLLGDNPDGGGRHVEWPLHVIWHVEWGEESLQGTWTSLITLFPIGAIQFNKITVDHM